MGMTGQAQLLLAHGFSVQRSSPRRESSPRQSGRPRDLFIRTERDDIRQRFGFLLAHVHLAHVHPYCIFGFAESDSANPWVPTELLQSLTVESRFCVLAAESSFSTFREIAYDRWVSPFTSASGSAALLFRPVVEFAFLSVLFAGNITSTCSKPRQKIQSQPPLFQSCSFTGQVDSNIPIRQSSLGSSER